MSIGVTTGPSDTEPPAPGVSGTAGAMTDAQLMSLWAKAPPVVYMLADHLDAALAHGEDLCRVRWEPERLGRCSVTIPEVISGQRAAVERIRTLELALTARVLKARERAREVARSDTRFAPVARLFAAGTAALTDAVDEIGHALRDDFDTADGVMAYLRSRGYIAVDHATADDCGAVRVDETMLIARRLPLSDLLNLTATFLDALDSAYDLYPEPGAEAGESADEPAAEPLDIEVEGVSDGSTCGQASGEA